MNNGEVVMVENVHGVGVRTVKAIVQNSGDLPPPLRMKLILMLLVT